MDERFLQASGIQAYTGSELLLKGALEGGVALVTGYPGSPLADFFDIPRQRQQLLDEYGIAFHMANNEALAAARLNGSQMADLKAMAVMKSVGAHVAADGLALGNLAKHGHRGGAIVVIGDDPWNESTQVPADSRFIAQHLHLPVMEPSTFQEIKDWIKHAFDLSATADLFIAYLVTTNQADGGGTVRVFSNQPPTISRTRPIQLEPTTFALEETVLLPPRTSQQEATLEERFARLIARAKALQLNQIIRGRPGETVGFISSGMAYCYLVQALDQLGLTGRYPMLKLGVSYPLDTQLIAAFVAPLTELVVVEEKRPFVESQVTYLIKELHQQGQLRQFPRIWGKHFPDGLEGFPQQRGLNPSMVVERLVPFLQRRWSVTEDGHESRERLTQVLQFLQETQHEEVSLPQRTPTFCPGCPHRDSSSVLLDIQRAFHDANYMRRRHHREPVELVFHGDTGCYTMLMFEPNTSLMHNYSGMGLGGGTGAGIDPFITNKQVVFMGDGTFFHGGMVAISDSIKHQQDITYVILDNKTTAMTGHQPTPGVDVDVMGHATVMQNIEAILQGMAQGTAVTIERTNPAYHANYRASLEETILKDGVKVVIADKECGITFHRRQRKEQHAVIKAQGFLPEERHVNITPEVCEYCLECTKATGCPGLTMIETPYGKKIATDLSNCVADKACTQRLVCPSFEEVIVHRQRPPQQQPRSVDSAPLPEPPRCAFDSAWYAYLAGVGGMGVGVIAAILVRAGMRDGFEVKFSDRKGLAIRNGGVYSYIGFFTHDKPISPIIPYGHADLLLGMDIIEAVRSIDPHTNFRVAHPQRTTALINTFETPTITMLVGKAEAADTIQLEQWLKRATRPETYTGFDASALSETHFGNRLYANLIMLGLAYQKGLLPVSGASLEWAIRESVPRDERDTNLAAFILGRRVALGEIAILREEVTESLEAVVALKRQALRRGWGGRRRVAWYDTTIRHAQADWQLPVSLLTPFARRVADLIEYEDIAYAARYRAVVEQVHQRDRAAFGWRATEAVIWYAHKVMAIKDEVYVAQLLTSPEKLARDKQRYRVDEANGDRIEYLHWNQPQFTIFGRDITFRLNTRNWHLRLMCHATLLRRLLPQWHRREKAFREWYLQLVNGFAYSDRTTYDRYVEILRVPETVRGYRDVRYPTMEEAQRAAERLAATLSTPVHQSATAESLVGADA